MTIIEDPDGDARSLMYRAPCICEGEANGIPCVHYWAVTQKFRASNADALRYGERNRACTLTAGLVLEFTSEEKPTLCNRYEPRTTLGLVSIGKRAVRAALGMSPKAGWGYESYNVGFSKFNPMTLEEIAKLREQFPDRPGTTWSQGGTSGKSPDMMSMDDIANGPQIGIVKPGEEAPPTGLSKETEAGLEGIFGGGDGIFTKKD